MNTQVPTLGKIAIIVVFILVAFGLALFFWLSFGGGSPFQAQGYRVSAAFNESIQVADEADVRISGVPVGKVQEIGLTGDGLTNVTMEIDDRYAPLPNNVKAILRQKTLLGETYVELTPGTKGRPEVPDGGSLRRSNVADSVQIDEVFRTFDPQTRRAFETWLQTAAVGYTGRGPDLSNALGNLPLFAESAGELVKILNSQQRAVTQLVANTGIVMGALNARGDQLRSLIENANTVFATTADRADRLQATFRALPTFEREFRTTVTRLTRFANTTNPLITQLRPAAPQVSALLQDIQTIAPDLRIIFETLGPIIRSSRKALPALDLILDDVRPVLGQLDPFLRNLNPIIDFIGLYKRELTAFFANVSASTQATDTPGGGNRRLHYLRTINPMAPEMLAIYPQRIGSNRSNPYTMPGAFAALARGLNSYETRGCGRGDPRFTSVTSDFLDSVSITTGLDQLPSLPGGARPNGSLRDLLTIFALGETQSTPNVPAPPCKQQGNFNIGGRSSQYPQIHVRPK